MTIRFMRINHISCAVLVMFVFWLAEAAVHTYALGQGPYIDNLLPSDLNELWMRFIICVLIMALGVYGHLTVKKIVRFHEERENLHRELERALTHVIDGFLPICSVCKKIRLENSNPQDRKSWLPIEDFIKNKSDVDFSHSYCPDCFNAFRRKLSNDVTKGGGSS